jgi:hypothetical protein
MGSLPAELVDRIIDYLHDDPQSLRATSLTCHKWLPSSHYHLFHEVKLTDGNYFGFFRLMESHGSTMGHLIRRITVQSVLEEEFSDASSTSSTMSSTSPSSSAAPLPSSSPSPVHPLPSPDDSLPIRMHLPPILANLSKVNSLRLSDIDWGEPLPPTVPFVCQLKGVKKLELSFVDFHDFTALDSLIMQFPQLEILNLTGILVENLEILSGLRFLSKKIECEIDNHMLDEEAREDFGPWLRARGMDRSLRSLFTTLEWGSSFAEHTGVVAAVQHLHIDMHQRNEARGIPVVDYRSYSNLCSIYLNNIPLFRSQAARPHFETYSLVETVLLQVASPSLERIGLNFECLEDEEFECFPWLILDDLLMQAPFANVTLVRIVLRWHSSLSGAHRLSDWETIAYIKSKCLPALASRGILCVQSALTCSSIWWDNSDQVLTPRQVLSPQRRTGN